MRSMSETQFCADTAGVVESVADEREEVVITRAGGESAVLVPLGDYESLRETIHLMRWPANSRRLLDAIDNLESVRGTLR